jgi:hypothetical protein
VSIKREDRINEVSNEYKFETRRDDETTEKTRAGGGTVVRVLPPEVKASETGVVICLVRRLVP